MLSFRLIIIHVEVVCVIVALLLGNIQRGTTYVQADLGMYQPVCFPRVNSVNDQSKGVKDTSTGSLPAGSAQMSHPGFPM